MIHVCTKLTPRVPLIYYVVTGWLLCVIALVLAAFASTVVLLIPTQGILLGLGIMLCETPLFLILNSWFVKRRGLAYGIYWGAEDVTAVAFGFLANYLLRTLGQRKTFLIFAAIILVAPAPCMVFIRERGTSSVFQRAPVALKCDNVIIEKACPPIDKPRRAFHSDPLFYILSTASFLHSIAFYIPQIYISTYALLTLHLPAYTSPLLLGLFNLAAIIGEVGFGALSDRYSIHTLIILCTSICAVTTVSLWGLAPLSSSHSAQIGILSMYAFIFGTAGSGVLGLWARIGLCFKPHKTHDDPKEKDESQVVFGWLCAGRGIGCIISGPISEALMARAEVATLTSFAGGPGWRTLVLFVGIVMVASAIAGIAGWTVDHDKRGVPEPRSAGVTNVSCIDHERNQATTGCVPHSCTSPTVATRPQRGPIPPRTTSRARPSPSMRMPAPPMEDEMRRYIEQAVLAERATM